MASVATKVMEKESKCAIFFFFFLGMSFELIVGMGRFMMCFFLSKVMVAFVEKTARKFNIKLLIANLPCCPRSLPMNLTTETDNKTRILKPDRFQ